MRINPHINRPRRNLATLDYYLDGIKAGDRFILSEAITLIESTHPRDRMMGLDILDKLDTLVYNTIRVSVSGSPGVGKSTFLDQLGMHIIDRGHKVAVLAIDPSSQQSKGSILGDKTRMATLTNQKNAYIRPTPSGEVLGGIAACTKETILLCEAAGFDVIFVETVGVGQSEIEVSRIVDMFLLLVLPGAGDDIQGIKRGITEMADAVIIHKADKERENMANISQKQYQQAMSLMRTKFSEWQPQVINVSSIIPHGIEKSWDIIKEFSKESKNTGHFAKRRRTQDIHWLKKQYTAVLIDYLKEHSTNLPSLADMLSKVIEEKITPYRAIKDLSTHLHST